ncbi:MAG: hypothetical protein K6B75_09020 [Lachnospiraceae bacterium]|nr:hypothetical protein [Lachnospiraceae bacterium]
MKNKQIGWKITVTVIIMIICAFLPAITLKLWDTANNYKVYVSELKTLKFSENIPDEDIFYLLCNGIWDISSEEETNLKYGDLYRIITTELSSYNNMGLVLSMPEEFYINERHIIYVRGYDNEENYIYIWMVVL